MSPNARSRIDSMTYALPEGLVLIYAHGSSDLQSPPGAEIIVLDH